MRGIFLEHANLRNAKMMGVQFGEYAPLRGGHKYDVKSIAFSPDGKLLASSSDDETIRLWDVATGQTVGKPLQGHSGPVNSVAFSPDSKLLASGGSGKTIRLWDVVTGQAVGKPLEGHSSSVTSVAFSPDGKLLASGSQDKTIRMWELFPNVAPSCSFRTGGLLCLSNSVIDGAEVHAQSKSLFRRFSVE
jgi:WD40 repeat protein